MKKIRVVEDDESQRQLYHDELTEAGYEVKLATTGKEVLNHLEKYRPDLIILDIVMPEMERMEAVGRIIRKYRDVPIILNTAYSRCRDDFMRWAADAFVLKSADLTKLKDKVQKILKEKEPQGLTNATIN